MKKKINIILTTVVLSLWGAVGYKYVNQFFYTDELPLMKEMNLNVNLPDIMKKDTFELEPLSNDPFLNHRISKPIVTRRIKPIASYKHKTKLKLEPKPLKTTIPFPTVNYFGFIKAKDKKDELILLKVNNTLHKTRVNQDCNGVVVKKVFKDSIQVVFEKQTRIIKK